MITYACLRAHSVDGILHFGPNRFVPLAIQNCLFTHLSMEEVINAPHFPILCNRRCKILKAEDFSISLRSFHSLLLLEANNTIIVIDFCVE